MKRFLLFVLAFTLLIPHKIYSQEKFTTSYETIYDVNGSGITDVSMDISLKNNFDTYYASSNTLTLGFDNIDNVKVKDPSGSITPTITKTVEGNSIDSEFNSEIIGVNKTLKYNIAFSTPDIARRKGSIWQVDIPGIVSPESYEVFNVEVNVPDEFGEVAYTKPQTSNLDLVFNKEELNKSGVSIAYGKYQNYGFNLKYHLANTNLFPVITEIALPPTTNYQDVYIKSINPKPVSVYVDEDGNWLAKYKLLPQKRLDVTVVGNARVYINPRQEELSLRQKNEYLKDDKYWEASDQEIKKLANELKTPENIYNYVVDTLKYDFSKVEDNKRLGALGALKNKDRTVCLEFTDLFIALARAAGIPAREVDGYAYTDNTDKRPLSYVTDILHAWPEYYDEDKKTWIMVDPTWGNTTGGTDYFHKLDFDHLTFVKRGINSEYPIPAGGYKYEENLEQKDVNVFFSDSSQISSNPKSEIKLKNSKFNSILPITINLIISNTTGIQIPAQKLIIDTGDLDGIKTLNLNSIPPYGQVSLDIDINNQDLLTNSDYEFKISYNNQVFNKSVSISPFVISLVLLIGGITIALLTILSVFIFTRLRRRV